MAKKTKYYTLDKISKTSAIYWMIIGRRSNGKTTACIGKSLKDFIDSGYKNQLAIIRRWAEDYKGAKGQQMMDGINALGWVGDWSEGEYNRIYYHSQRWYLAYFDEEGNKTKQCPNPFAYAFSLASEEHYKSTSYPDVVNVLFDEFLTRTYYLPDEFIKFQNLISTIVRNRDDHIQIMMCGNTVSKFSPYFEEMGLKNIDKQQPNSIDVYTYGDTDLKVAVEYCDGDIKNKSTNKYFAFNNPKLQMITTGAWEIDIYPHLPCLYTPSEEVYKFYIDFNRQKFDCIVICSETTDSVWVYIHRKTSEIKPLDEELVFSCETVARWNYRRFITRPEDDLSAWIFKFFKNNMVFYQDNEVGEVIRSYIMWSQKEPYI